jgi:peptidoglycan hydrolase-like protein with peptidoglycan-binding domain
MSGLGLAVLAGLLLLASGKKKAAWNVDIGPVKILPRAAAKPAAKPKPVRAATPTSIQDTAAAAVQAAAPAGVAPIPNAEAARKLAQPLADYIRNNRKKYDHARVATWQAFAGLVPDGIYGPKTAKALRAFGAKSVVG